MAGNAASRQGSHGVQRVSATLRTRRNRVVSQVRLDVLGAHSVAGALLVFQRPLVFGACDGSQIVDTGIGGDVNLQLLELLVLGSQPFVFGHELL